MHVLYITTTYDRGRVEHFALLLLSSSDDAHFRFLLQGADFSTGEVGDVLCDEAEEKSDSESESDELDDSTVTRRRWTIMMAENGSKLTLESKMCAGGHEIL
jgi:hypothetical protein